MKTILDVIERNASKFIGKPLFCDKDKSIKYDEFYEFIKNIASGLFENGLKKPIAVFDNRNVNTILGMFGVLESGNFYVVIDSKSPVERIQKIYDILNPVASILETENIELFDQIKNKSEKKYLIEELKTYKQNEKHLNDIKSKIISTDAAYVLFTSGSTGMPKGTIVTHSNILSYIEWFINEFNIDENTIFGNQTPFYFSMSVSDIYATIMTGATFNIIPKTYFSFPIQLINFMNERKINTIYWVPSALSIVANLKLFNYAKPEYLKLVLFAGEVMQNKQLNYWRRNLNNVKFANLFGPTETTDICTFYVINREFRDDESLPIGVHCDNLDTFIVDENGNEVKEQDKIGELYVRGNFVASGYYDNEEKTNAVFVQNPLNKHYPEIVYKTGDLVKLNQYGEYEYAGRKDFQIKHMGYRIELGEIEANAGSVDGVNAVACVYDASNDLIIMFYDGKINVEEYLNVLSNKVPKYMVPNKVKKLKQMPYNQNGKIDRNYLKTNLTQLLQD